MFKTECENCGKDVLSKIGFCIDLGIVGGGGAEEVAMVSLLSYPKEIKKCGIFCSLECLKEWINKQKKLTPPKELLKDFKRYNHA